MPKALIVCEKYNDAREYESMQWGQVFVHFLQDFRFLCICRYFIYLFVVIVNR